MYILDVLYTNSYTTFNFYSYHYYYEYVFIKQLTFQTLLKKIDFETSFV